MCMYVCVLDVCVLYVVCMLFTASAPWTQTSSFHGSGGRIQCWHVLVDDGVEDVSARAAGLVDQAHPGSPLAKDHALDAMQFAGYMSSVNVQEQDVALEKVIISQIVGLACSCCRRAIKGPLHGRGSKRREKVIAEGVRT